MIRAMRGLGLDCICPMANGPQRTAPVGGAMESNDDPFCDAPGARLAQATRDKCLFAWRRFLGFLAIGEPLSLADDPAERLTIERVRSYVSHLAETNAPQSVARSMGSTRPLGS